MTQNRIRIESNENVVTNAKIFYLPPEGELFDKKKKPVSEVDISRCVTGVDIHLHVGEAATATLHTILVDARVEADVEEVIINQIRTKSKLWRWRQTVKSNLKRWVARSLSHEIRRELNREAMRRRR